MVKVCIYCNRKYPDGNITFHKFPSDKERRKKWLSAMKIPNEDIDKNNYLCSEHFEEKTYSSQVVNNIVYRFLYMNAVPSIFEQKERKTSENEPDVSQHNERSKENQNDAMQVSQQCEVEEEDRYYYKIVDGMIHRYLRDDLKMPVSSPIGSNNQENPSNKVKQTVEANLYTESTQVAERKTVHVEAPVKVELLPDIQLPTAIRNGEIYSTESICDFKSNDFKIDQEPTPIFQDFKMDAQDVIFDQINQYSNLNGMNEVEITTCVTEPLENNQQEEISVSQDFDVNVEEFKMDVDQLTEDTAEDIGEKETTDKTEVKKNRLSKGNSTMQESGEICGNKGMKTLLYKCLENKNSPQLDNKLKRYTKHKLIDLLNTALNYIECLEDKLTVTTEKNSQYKTQISELENLLESISDGETSKTNSA